MTDYLDLALKYGGFTSLDKVYLEKKLASMSDQEKLDFITPPPSVINAYFAELYQKKAPQAATDYYFDLSQALKLFDSAPSFEENKPFIRLNLSGKSFGFAYVSDKEVAQVFAEADFQVTSDLLFDLAQIFPQYGIFAENGQIFMQKLTVDSEFETVEQTQFLLTEIGQNADYVKISGFNQEEVELAGQDFPGQKFYAWSGRSAILYIKK
ncbi:cystathionine beta-lyase [Streptococcus gallolyticus]|nr:cystathionine beta-lyase [Streptococcus gallolyticus]MBY5041175.1 cystathionine beta-lyase [Streptococcus gallolyticus]